MRYEFNLSDKECNILINEIDLEKENDKYPNLYLRGKESLKFEKGFFKEDVKEFIREIKALLDDDVDQRELYLSKQIDKLAGEKLK